MHIHSYEFKMQLLLIILMLCACAYNLHSAYAKVENFLSGAGGDSRIVEPLERIC